MSKQANLSATLTIRDLHEADLLYSDLKDTETYRIDMDSAEIVVVVTKSGRFVRRTGRFVRRMANEAKYRRSLNHGNDSGDIVPQKGSAEAPVEDNPRREGERKASEGERQVKAPQNIYHCNKTAPPRRVPSEKRRERMNRAKNTRQYKYTDDVPFDKLPLNVQRRRLNAAKRAAERAAMAA